MKKLKLYLSGPMTGVKDLNVPAFNRMAKLLRVAGYKVVNPPELDRIQRCRTWEECLRRDLRFVVKCDAVATLPRWTKSKGANLEIHVGRALNMPVHTAEYFLRRKP